MVKTLIAEDDKTYLDRLRYTVQQRGSEVETATTAREALDIFRHFPIDLLITDIVLGDGRDGLELAETITAESHDVTVIVITAFGSSAREEQAERLGASLYLEKPFDLRILRQCVQVAIDRCELRKRVRELQPLVPEATALPDSEYRVDSLWLAIMNQLIKKRPLREISEMVRKGKN